MRFEEIKERVYKVLLITTGISFVTKSWDFYPDWKWMGLLATGFAFIFIGIWWFEKQVMDRVRELVRRG